MTALAPEVAVMAEQVTGRGPNGVVVAAAPLAAQAAAAVLGDGGNAFDAVVTAALAETVLLPPKCGLGGDLVAIVLRAGAVEPEALVAVGGAPSGLADVARRGAWRDVGPNSVGPPAAGAGHAALAALGRLGRERLAAPARRLALDGFPWAAVCTRLAEQAAGLVREFQPDGCVFYPDGDAIAPGVLTRLPGLARAIDEWVTRGASLLDGPLGDAIVDTVHRHGGVLSRADLAHVAAEWLPCASVDIDGRPLWATPAPTHGPGLLDAMLRYANADRSSTGLHAAVMAAIAAQRDALGDASGTSIVSAADRDGNVVVVVHSNSYPRFGSGLVVEEFDLPLANRAGRGFTPQEDHPNFPVAGRRPATTLHAWAVGDATGTVRLMGGTPGGANQLPWNAQSLARVLAGEERPGVLVAAPIWEWLPDDDGLRIEGGFEDPPQSATRNLTAPRWGCKSAQQVVRVPRDGDVWEAAADPRTVGLALGL
jgi:gamma-glutamyltranspeptidase/glutathione hydrolase